MRFLIVGDLHGKVPKIAAKDFDAIIAPGDFCSDGSKYYQFKALKLRMEGRQVEWEQLVGKRRAKQMIDKSVRDGRAILKKLNSFGKPVYVVPGNWDREEDWPKLKRGLKHIVDVHQRSVDAGELTIIGHGYISGPEYPPTKKLEGHYTKQELKLKKREFDYQMKEFSKLIKKSKKPVLLLSHNVPYNTPIDKIVNKDSPRNGQHLGSLIARRLIDQHHPLLCIGGHMHEHFRAIKMGKTTAINAGFGPDVNVLLEIEKGKIKRKKFTRLARL